MFVNSPPPPTTPEPSLRRGIFAAPGCLGIRREIDKGDVLVADSNVQMVYGSPMVSLHPEGVDARQFEIQRQPTLGLHKVRPSPATFEA